jgi:hypothetical protein
VNQGGRIDNGDNSILSNLARMAVHFVELGSLPGAVPD